MGALLEREALLAALARRRESGARVVLTNGIFDLLHVGHLRYLTAARALGDCLIVGINDDASTARLKGPRRPIVPATDRAELVAGLACVDYVTVFGTDTAVDLVEAVRPEIYAKGGDYAATPGGPGTPLPEAPAVLAGGGRVHLLPLVADNSSTRLIERVLARYAADRG
jgi:D-glycero-beta-D-manno-heptose 1-phosphate adenylyltransferase